MAAIKIGTFMFASIRWNIVIDRERCLRKKENFEVSINDTTIYLSDYYQGTYLRTNIVEYNLWVAIVDAMLWSLSLNKYNNNKFIMPLAAMILEFKNTYSGSSADWNGTFKLMGVEWSVNVDNEECDRLKLFGISDLNRFSVLLETHNDHQPISPDKVYVTLIHEMLHSIMGMLGKWNHKYLNGESFICTSSELLSQVYKSIHYKIPERCK